MKTKQQMTDAQTAQRKEDILHYATPPNDLYAANASDARRLVRLLELLGFTTEEPYAQTTINAAAVAPEIPLSEIEALGLAGAELNLNVRVAGAPDGRNVAAELRRFLEMPDAYTGLRDLFESVKVSLPNEQRQTAEVILSIPAVLASVKRSLESITA